MKHREETWFAKGSVSSLGEVGSKAAEDVDSESSVFSFTAEHEDIPCSKDSNLLSGCFLEGHLRPMMKCRMYDVNYIYRLVSQNSS